MFWLNLFSWWTSGPRPAHSGLVQSLNTNRISITNFQHQEFLIWPVWNKPISHETSPDKFNWVCWANVSNKYSIKTSMLNTVEELDGLQQVAMSAYYTALMNFHLIHGSLNFFNGWTTGNRCRLFNYSKFLKLKLCGFISCNSLSVAKFFKSKIYILFITKFYNPNLLQIWHNVNLLFLPITTYHYFTQSTNILLAMSFRNHMNIYDGTLHLESRRPGKTCFSVNFKTRPMHGSHSACAG